MTIIYTLASVLSAFLVFFIQPVVAKIALPTLGGTPAVWSGCMLFFQAVLLLGYSYAHLLTGRVPLRAQPVLHLALLAVVVLTFPIAFDGLASIDAAVSPLSWLLTMLLVSVGLPYFAISATSPLLQRWFSRTDHKDAANPYFLYAASNIGSMAALLLYPFVVEPFASLATQVHLWEIGIAILLLVFLGVGTTLYKRGVAYLPSAVENQTQNALPINAGTRFRWLALSFVPSSLLYGVTTYVTTDIASVPLLWILPLVLYLTTFIMVFAKHPRGVDTALFLSPVVIITLLAYTVIGKNSTTAALLFHICGFFIIALALHGLLSRNKPAAQHLTGFFLWMSLGGVLGGVFNTLVAPFIFNSVLEYPLALLAALLIEVAVSGGLTHLKSGKPTVHKWNLLVTVLAAIFAGLAFTQTISSPAGKVIYHERSLFGVSKVVHHQKGDINIYVHGTTYHGMQSLLPQLSLEPTSYYTQLNELFASAHGLPIAAIGLGVGTLSTYAAPGQEMDFFEIDPLVVDIARNPQYFTHLRDSKGTLDLIIGDGRQQISHQPDGKYGVIVMDAFSSDAIPIHLITEEALALYVTKLAPDGIIAFHITNRHINLKPVLAVLTGKLGLHARFRKMPKPADNQLVAGSLWVLVARDENTLERAVGKKPEWQLLQTVSSPRYLWTDDYSNILLSLVLVQKWLGLAEN